MFRSYVTSLILTYVQLKALEEKHWSCCFAVHFKLDAFNVDAARTVLMCKVQKHGCILHSMHSMTS